MADTKASATGTSQMAENVTSSPTAIGVPKLIGGVESKQSITAPSTCLTRQFDPAPLTGILTLQWLLNTGLPGLIILPAASKALIKMLPTMRSLINGERPLLTMRKSVCHTRKWFG